MKTTKRALATVLAILSILTVFSISSSAAELKPATALVAVGSSTSLTALNTSRCGCVCHTKPGIIHNTPCCSQYAQDNTLIRKQFGDFAAANKDYDVAPAIARALDATPEFAREAKSIAAELAELSAKDPKDTDLKAISEFANILAAAAAGKRIQLTAEDMLAFGESLGVLDGGNGPARAPSTMDKIKDVWEKVKKIGDVLVKAAEDIIDIVKGDDKEPQTQETQATGSSSGSGILQDRSIVLKLSDNVVAVNKEALALATTK